MLQKLFILQQKIHKFCGKFSSMSPFDFKMIINIYYYRDTKMPLFWMDWSNFELALLYYLEMWMRIGSVWFCDPKRKGKNWEMENLLERFPFVAKSIFSKLDNTSLVQAKEVCSTWRNSINSQKFSWIRIIQTHIDDKQELASIWWHRVLLKTSVETVKELSTAVYQFYQFDKTRYYKKKWSPLHITVERDSLNLSQQNE